jgi:hypothetical protein
MVWQAFCFTFLQYNIKNLGLSVPDTAMSFAHIDRRSMYVVEHHDDFFSWKNYNNYTHMIALYEHGCKGVAECGNKLFM